VQTVEPLDGQQAPGEQPSTQTTKEAAQAEPEDLLPNSETSRLFDSAQNVKSYQVNIALLPDGRARYTYAVRGNRAKVTLVTPIDVPNGIVEVVYLDFVAKTANGYCEGKTRGCDPLLGHPLAFEDYDIMLPPQWIDQLRYGEKTRTRTFENYQVNTVRMEKGGKFYEALVHTYWGLPVRIAIADDTEMTQIVGGYEYRNIDVNKLKDADVTPPSS
jgi:hypothetical protein